MDQPTEQATDQWIDLEKDKRINKDLFLFFFKGDGGGVLPLGVHILALFILHLPFHVSDCNHS